MLKHVNPSTIHEWILEFLDFIRWNVWELDELVPLHWKRPALRNGAKSAAFMARDGPAPASEKVDSGICYVRSVIRGDTSHSLHSPKSIGVIQYDKKNQQQNRGYYQHIDW